MGQYRPAEFYDGIKYMKPHIYERYKVIYEAAADLLPKRDICPKIVDLGCGVGYFAKTVRERGYTDYFGVDFSRAMIAFAKQNVPDFTFVQDDLFGHELDDCYLSERLFVLLEVLEHIKDDIKLLEIFQSGSRIIFSMPSYDAKSHVRYFRHENKIVNRYKHLLNFKTIKIIPWKKSNKVFLFDCIRR